MKTLLTSLIFAAATLFLQGQESDLLGNVVDTRHIPVSEATIYLYDSNNEGTLYEASTDVNGRFMVSDIPDGTYKVEIYSQGYLLDSLEKISISNANETTQLDFYVQPVDNAVVSDSNSQ